MTIHFRAVPQFHQLPKEEAEKILYDELLPACEAKGVYLAPEGNMAAINDMTRYQQCKEERKTFWIPSLQEAFTKVDQVYRSSTQYRQLDKTTFENRACYVSGGELMAVMMLKGYEARFQKRGSDHAQARADFKVTYVAKRSRDVVG